jgi:hypothetical protein
MLTVLISVIDHTGRLIDVFYAGNGVHAALRESQHRLEHARIEGAGSFPCSAQSCCARHRSGQILLSERLLNERSSVPGIATAGAEDDLQHRPLPLGPCGQLVAIHPGHLNVGV